jgi:quinoprotein glucose dehydrogenase
LTLKIGDQPDTVISKASITKRTDAASSMPPMRVLLTKKEMRDVVSFLATMEE